MNGKTNASPMNPCEAEMDKHTYGWRLLNVTTHGARLIKISVLGVCLDLYRSTKRLSWERRFLYARIKNGATIFFPFGSLSWPMPDKGLSGGKAA